MRIAAEIMKTPQWTLRESRAVAASLLKSPRETRALVPLLFSQDPEMRVRAADVARRMTDGNATCLGRYADEIIGALGEVPLEESRARWHLALVAARSALKPRQIGRLAPMLLRMMNESSNVLRCSAIEGLAELALRDASLKPVVTDVCHAALSGGTLAMINRAQHALKRLAK